jgi:CheY-like chemotaxis protein
MNGILGFSRLLQESKLSGEEQGEYINIIQASGERMLNTINDIICIARIESGQMELLLKKTNINEQIEYIYAFFKHEAEQKGLRLLFNNGLPKDAAVITTDKEKLYGILTNLVKNAIKFTKTGTIEFGYEHKGGFLEFYVTDSGIGIPKERQEAIFERFVQADIGDKRAYQGSGLGLSIAKAYVEMLGGKIRLESEKGHGTKFYFTIPYKFEPEKDIAKAESTVNQTGSEIPKLKILIADDDPSSELFLAIAVKKYCREVFKVRNGTDAIEICRNNPDLDLILMDIKMPEMDGYEATRQIREFNKQVVIIAQTAYALTGERDAAIAAGCNDYISKPFSVTALTTMVSKYFKK